LVQGYFLRADIEDIKDVRGKDAKEILFKQKENDWLKFNYPLSYLNEMKQMKFWDHEYHKIEHYDKVITEMRGKDLK